MSLDVWLEKEVTEIKDVFSANITHNLGDMAAEAGIYDCLWHPDNSGISKAIDLIGPLTRGLVLMKDDPERFKVYDADNGWGVYDDFVPWIEKYLDACIENPEANVSASR